MVWSETPDAMFVKTQAASNFSSFGPCWQKYTIFGMMPALMHSWMGGLVDTDNRLRMSRVALMTSCGVWASSAAASCCTICESLIACVVSATGALIGSAVAVPTNAD